MQQWVWLKMKIWLKGKDKLKLYQYHTKLPIITFVKMWNFTHHNPKSAPAMTEINFGLC